MKLDDIFEELIKELKEETSPSLNEVSALATVKNKEGDTFIVTTRTTKGAGKQDEVMMHILKKGATKPEKVGSHVNLKGALAYGKNRGFVKGLKLKNEVVTESLVEGSIKTLSMLFKNKGIKDAIKKEKADHIRKAIEKEGIPTKGVSDDEIIQIAKELSESTVNEAFKIPKKGSEIRFKGWYKIDKYGERVEGGRYIVGNVVNDPEKGKSLEVRNKSKKRFVPANTLQHVPISVLKSAMDNGDLVVSESTVNEASPNLTYINKARAKAVLKKMQGKPNNVYGDVDSKTKLVAVDKNGKTHPITSDSDFSYKYAKGYKWAYATYESVVNEAKVNRKKLSNDLWDRRGYELDYLNKLSDKKLKSLWDTEFYHESVVNEAKFKKGQVVIPNAGPHKGVKHKIIHCFDDGRCNIQPIGLKPRDIKYRLGAATVKPNQIKLAESVSESKFIAFYNNKGHDISAKDSKDAKKKAAKMLKIPAGDMDKLTIATPDPRRQKGTPKSVSEKKKMNESKLEVTVPDWRSAVKVLKSLPKDLKARMELEVKHFAPMTVVVELGKDMKMITANLRKLQKDKSFQAFRISGNSRSLIFISVTQAGTAQFNKDMGSGKYGSLD